jgi:hypothetical protein
MLAQLDSDLSRWKEMKKAGGVTPRSGRELNDIFSVHSPLSFPRKYMRLGTGLQGLPGGLNLPDASN